MAYTTINKSTDYFNTKLYTGNGGTQSITGVGFQPDWVWGKERTSTSSHFVFDAVRGATKNIHTNTNAAETTPSPDGGLTSFDSDGFSTSSWGAINESGQTYASWNWKAGGGQGSSNTDGSINTTYTSANTTAGFSISTYTGTGSNATVGHGLGSVPKMIIVKRTNATDVWRVYHSSIGATKHLVLNTTAAEATGSNVWNDTAPTSSVFSISTDSAVNASGATYVAYCFAEKTGYSKFGTYTGNNNADGTFVYTGFKPSFIMIKSSSAGGDNAYSWSMFDNKRSSYNIERAMLKANLSDAEYTSGSNADIDILSNGFKLRASPNETNGSNTYIYMAFGQSIVGSNNVPAVAR
jgi:hypothetical protein